ncbi:hypothetical protein [Vibrio sp. V01_P9A10T6]|uniref:hypothetical protein n=1 Tax=Vibrio sp. V01_P9A10T6 TaxID=2116368 RepID=UPI000D023BB8|nr:hypothetical protein [Vibrio sp. V01_P9A10T6]PRQ63260.1 hypothetical protein BWR16_06095 [Vibrio sp. V01_P9A10T6]
MGSSVSIELAYSYAMMALDQELKRFDSLDNKANKFLGLISVVLGVLVSVIGWGFDKFFPPVTAMQCWVVFLLFLIISNLSLAWHYLFKSIKVSDFPTLKLDRNVSSTLCDFEEENIKTIIISYQELLSEHKSVMLVKEYYVEKAYKCISYGAMLTLMALFFIMVSQL